MKLGIEHYRTFGLLITDEIDYIAIYFVDAQRTNKDYVSIMEWGHEKGMTFNITEFNL